MRHATTQELASLAAAGFFPVRRVPRAVREPVRGGVPRRLAALAIGAVVIALVAGPTARAVEPRPGVAPVTPWACPASHPIKGYVSRESGRRVYYVPGSRFYEEASPERCYATEDEALRDGSRPAGDAGTIAFLLTPPRRRS